MRRRGNPRSRSVKKNNINIDFKKVGIPAGIALLIIVFISVIFSLLNIGNNKIVNGVKIGDINVAGLTQAEATEKINTWKNEIVLKDIKVKYENFEEHINVQELKPDFDTDKLVRDALAVGKSGNIIKDNYEILFTMLFSKQIPLDISLNEQELKKQIKEINSNLPNALEESGYYIEESNLIVKKGKAGNEIEKDKFIELLNNTIKNENKEINIPIKQSNPTEINIDNIYNEIYKETKNAYITKDPVEVHPEVNGVDFAISKEEAKNMLNEQKEEYIIPLKITLAETTIEDLGKEAFPHLLGTFSTTYSMANSNRVNNLELAAEKINGTIILPDETFSYNKVVGQRTIAAGYKEAAVYSGGRVVDGIGGGICQISSTLYNAAIYANLEITERSNHMFFTSYVEVGRDATVSWGSVDFCFKNTRKYPIKIVSTVKNGVVTCQIYGMKEEVEYEIIIDNQVEEVIPFTTKYVKDYEKNENEEEVKQGGSNGAKSITYKIKKYNGAVVSKEILSEDSYSPLDRIIVKGTKKVESANAPIFATSIEEDEPEEIVEEINPNLLELIKEL